MVKVGIVGGTGYTGVELLRLLARHEGVQLHAVTSRKEAGMKVAEMFPSLRGRVDLAFSTPEEANLAGCDVVFFATPNGIAMGQARELLATGVKIIDLAADFRIKDVAEWEKWYGMSHASPELVAEAVYGLPEANREQIRSARLVANPGCYPTAVQLGFLPLIEAGVKDGSIPTEYPREAAELLSLLPNYWLMPYFYPVTLPEMEHRIRCLATMLDAIGVPIFDDELITVAAKGMMTFAGEPEKGSE